MNLTTWHYIGIAILTLDIVWIVFFYYYATVKVYNLCEGKHYRYLGYLWIRKKRGEWYLTMPVDMVEHSVTTKYKIISASWFHKFRKGEKMHISFAEKYRVEVRVSAKIYVQNYIGANHYL